MVSMGDEMREKEPRGMGMTADSRFRFRCHPGLACFTRCCRDVNIFLTPYDVLGMKKRLNISSSDFLERYTVTVIPEVSGFPLVLLRMQEDQDKACPFVAPTGCSIYEDRPWSCRMYPLDREADSFYVIAAPELCHGMAEEKDRTVAEYLQTQEVSQYEEMEEYLRSISSNPRWSGEKIRNPKVREMCRMAMYDLDRFRRFVFESRFLEIFEVDRDTAQRIREDDLELMRLALRWLEFGLVAGDIMRIREDILEGKSSYKNDQHKTKVPGGNGPGE